MPDVNIPELKRNIVAIGRLLWEKELVSALNGNISARVDDERVILTATKTCLGLLQEKDVLLMNLNGQVLEEGEVSSEKPLHTEIYKNFPDVKAIIHTHTLFTNAYFLENDSFTPRIFEAKFWFGELNGVTQHTPTVTDVGPTIDALKKNSIAVLRNHGVVAVGKDLFSCFLLIQTLEDALETEAMARVFQSSVTLGSPGTRHQAPDKARKPKMPETKPASLMARKYKLFSKEQINAIVKRVNADLPLKELGLQTQMNLSLAIKSSESNKVFNFQFVNGKITKVGNDDHAEFLLTAPQEIWRQVFNRQIDPFVATTQKKIVLKGDFGKLSKWYGAFQRVFELWQQIPVE